MLSLSKGCSIIRLCSQQQRLTGGLRASYSSTSSFVMFPLPLLLVPMAFLVAPPLLVIQKSLMTTSNGSTARMVFLWNYSTTALFRTHPPPRWPVLFHPEYPHPPMSTQRYP